MVTLVTLKDTGADFCYAQCYAGYAGYAQMRKLAQNAQFRTHAGIRSSRFSSFLSNFSEDAGIFAESRTSTTLRNFDDFRSLLHCFEQFGSEPALS